MRVPQCYDSISIVSLSGAVLLSQKLNSTKTLIDTSEIPNGLYIVRIYNGLYFSNYKVIKSK
jgi:hypothetical protein